MACHQIGLFFFYSPLVPVGLPLLRILPYVLPAEDMHFLLCLPRVFICTFVLIIHLCLNLILANHLTHMCVECEIHKRRAHFFCSSVCKSFQCLISTVTQGTEGVTYFGSLVQLCCREGGALQTNIIGM